MSKVKELLEREENFKNWTLDELWELENVAMVEFMERKAQEKIVEYLNSATTFNEFKLLVKKSDNHRLNDLQDDYLMTVWIDFMEGKDNSK